MSPSHSVARNQRRVALVVSFWSITSDGEEVCDCTTHCHFVTSPDPTAIRAADWLLTRQPDAASDTPLYAWTPMLHTYLSLLFVF